MTDSIQIYGRVRGQVLGPDGQPVRSFAKRNLVVTAGLELIAAILESSSPTRPSHMAIGDGGSEAALGQTVLQGTEHERVAFDSQSLDGQEVTYNATFGNNLTSDVTVREGGIFNDASAGVMLARFVPDQLTLFASETLDIEWTIGIGEP